MLNTEPAAWHRARNKQILGSYPAIKSLQGYDPKLIWKIIYIPSLFWACTYLAASISVPLIILLAATLGAFCKMNVFNIMHELTHDLVHPALKGKLKTSLMFIIQIPMCGSNFAYYQWFHRSHHALLGLESLAEARNKAYGYNAADGDLLTYPILNTKHKASDQTTSNKIWLRTPLRRMFWFGCYTPLMRCVTEMLLVIGALWLRIFSAKRSKNDFLSILDKIIILSALAMVYTLWGWKSLGFVLCSQLFYLGFLFHPCLAFWIAVHKSHASAQNCQPTSSVYGKVMNLFCGGCNYHAEHHDFTNIPVARLKDVHTIAHSFYSNITHYASFIDVYQAILDDDSAQWVYGCQ